MALLQILIEQFFRNRSGSILVAFAIGVPVIVGAAGLGVDLASMSNQRGQLQAAADAGALAAAKEMSLPGARTELLETLAEDVARANLSGPPSALGSTAEIIATADMRRAEIIVEIAQEPVTTIMGNLGASLPPLAVEATAKPVGGKNLCVMALAEGGVVGAITLEDDASISAPNCVMHSASTHNWGIQSRNAAMLEGEIICSAGGYRGVVSNYSPAPITDCPSPPDPLERRPAPANGPCDFDNLTVSNPGGTVVLDPGVYCRRFIIENDTDVILNPGVYVLNGARLQVRDTSSLTGEGVGFYFVGPDAYGSHFRIQFQDQAEISLTAPTSGPLAGLLFFEDDSLSNNRRYLISTPNAHTLIGTIYLPKGRLIVNTSGDVAQDSAYTAIVSRLIEVTGNANLVLNTDYDATDVPVPEGIGPLRLEIVLAE